MLSRSRLKELLEYNPLTGIFVRKITLSPRTKVGDIAGSTNKCGYIQICVDRRYYLAHRLAWFYVYGKWPKKDLDHKDHIRHHNWIDNLREATNKENSKNASISKNNTSGFNGVSYNKAGKVWVAYCSTAVGNKYLGCFKNKADAIDARKEANLKHGFHENHGKKEIL